MMANVREETLNTHLALLLDRYDGITARPELRSREAAVDITVTHSSSSSSIPILVEAKIGNTPAKRRQAASQARSRLRVAPRALAFGVCYPSHLRDASLSASATQAVLSSCDFAFAPVSRIKRDPTWREGTVGDFANTLMNTDLSRQSVADSIEYTVREAANLLHNYGCAGDIAQALVLPRKSDEDLGAATLVGALMVSNAALLHQRLRLVEQLQGIVSLERALRVPDRSPRVIREAWTAILAVDYHPVFKPGLAVLNAVADDDLTEPLRWIGDNAIAAADELASLRFDHAGPLYHRLLSSSRFDGSFYTDNISALLLARLALTEQTADWASADALANLKIIDPACGTGTLLMAAMHAIRDRHERAALDEADSDLLHLALVEDVLYGLDINRHGVQLAACNLTLGNPRVDYRRMNLFTVKHGPQPNGKTKAGSIEFLATAHNERDIARLALPLPTTAGLDAERAEPGAAPTEPLTGLFDLVIMNPPFTRNDLRNRQYGRGDRRRLREREIEIARSLRQRDKSAVKAIHQTSVESFFSPLADVFLKRDEATLAVVVPTTALTGASSLPKRRFLAERFQIEAIVTSHDPTHINFSENTTIHESLMVARRPRSERTPTKFIALARMPRDAHEAILLSDRINRAEPLGKWGVETLWPWPRVREGDWSAAQFFDGSLAEAMHDLAALGGTRLTAAGKLCRIEPEGRRIRDAFLSPSPRGHGGPEGIPRSPRMPASPPADAPWTAPILWDHRTDIQTSMNAEADVLGVPKTGKEGYAQFTLAPRASRLLVVSRLRTDTVRVSACFAEEPLLGSAWIPVSPRSPDRRFEHALCAWWNSTPGILTLLHSRAKALDYTRYALKALRSLLVPDPNGVDITPLSDAFAICRSQTLLAWPKLHACPSRAILDEAAARVLRIDGRKIAGWRRRIALEPTVSRIPAAKRTRPGQVESRATSA